jgi:hypothetical protein
VPKARWKSDPSLTKGQSQPAVAPIDLSLADDDAGLSLGTQTHALSRHSSSTSDKDRTLGQKGSVERDGSGYSTTAKKMVSMNSPENNEEALYEYFPLTLDDW